MYELWKHYGSMEWSSLVEPARRLASEGFPATRGYVRALKALTPVLREDKGSRETYLMSPPERPGDPVRFPGLARLLELIGDDPLSFYRGEPADAIVEYLSSLGGVLDKGDLESYSPAWGRPLSAEYRGWRVYEMPPNTQGITTLHILKILEQWRIPRDPGERFYYILSASPPAYRVRDLEVGDPVHMRVDPEALLSSDVLDGLRSEARRGSPSCLEMNLSGARMGDTTAWSIADREGVVVSGIQSLYMPFGSALTVPKYQVTLHNRASGFTTVEDRPNTVGPRKRPLHTLSSVIMENAEEETIISLGISGGHYRPQQHAHLITGIVDAVLTPGEAVSQPRALWTPWSCEVITDKGFRPRLPLGYRLRESRTGVASTIWIRGDLRASAADPRGDGIPLAGV